MNLLILKPEQLVSDNRAVITGRQLDHILQVHRLAPGDKLKTGLLNGQLGTGQVLSLTNVQAEISLELNTPPPAPVDITVVLALPRPKVLRRILQDVTILGIKQLYLINSYRVEKSYWQTPVLQPENVEQQFILGLEQSVDTRLPTLHIAKRFKPFTEDVLPGLVEGRQALFAHPYTDTPCPLGNARKQARLIVIGPEGGFIPYEVEKLQSAGCQPVSLGPRILKVGQAINYMVGRLAEQ